MVSSSKTLYKRLVELYNTGQNDELVSKAEAAWPELKRLPMNTISGECCRFTMLAYIKKNDPTRAAIWKARAVARFANVSSIDGIAALLIPDAMRFKKDTDVALDIFNDMERLFTNKNYQRDADFSYSAQRLLHEKRGYILADVKRHYDGAIKEYRKALRRAKEDRDNRGIIKVELGLVLCKYLLNAKDDDQRKKAVNEQIKLVKDFAKPEYKESSELERTARGNLTLMLEKAIVQHEEFTWYEF